MLSETEIRAEIDEVEDPELGVGLDSLGLIYEVAVDGDRVSITHTLTTPSCPVGPQLQEQMRERLLAAGAAEVEIEMTFKPPWSPRMMSEDTRFALGLYF